ncbi:MAG: hypothetical protein AB7L91_09210 [Dehalococcoidia bacterium]
MAGSEPLDLALRLWPQARDRGTVDDPTDLDRLLEAQGLPGAPGYECGLRSTFACFGPDEAASLTLPTGEQPGSDESARFLAHLVVTRTLLAVGLSIDERVAAAMTSAHALSWATAGGGNYHQEPIALATSLWLVALDPDGSSDRPLPIDWSVECLQGAWWDPDERLFSHYDMRERALDWAAYVSYDTARHEGCSIWTIVEPLLRLEQDTRARLALAQLSGAADVGQRASAAAMLERNRVAGMLRSYFGPAGANGSTAQPGWRMS